MFLNYAFAAGRYTLDQTATNTSNATSIKIANGVFDQLYATSEALSYSTTIPSIWNFYTIMDAKFNGNLLAGNIDFAVSEVDSLRIKRRIKGTIPWIILHEQAVSTASDLIIAYYDITNRANTTYEYAIVPVFDQVEGAFYISEVTTNYQGLFIVDKDNVFSTELDVQISEKRNKPRSIITPLNRKYPYVISNGTSNYDSGSVSAEWLEYDSDSDAWDITGGRDFVVAFKDFLNDGLPKLLKYEDGRMWLIDISSSEIADSEDEMHLQIHTSFDWTEIGDCDSADDLYVNGFLDVDQ